ncbi:MAG: hypothetical protein WBA57_16340 [Elainellaceae cyanobacterium]
MDVDGMSYRQWQKRNTEFFRQLTKAQQKTARQQGYYNISWEKVRKSWEILQQLASLPSLFNAKLKKDDLTGAIGQSILEAEQAQEMAKQSVANLKQKRKQIQELAKKTLNKYQLL